MFFFFVLSRFLTIMQWQWWLGENPTHLACLTQLVTFMFFRLIYVFFVFPSLLLSEDLKNVPVSLMIIPLRSGGLWQAASSQLSTDRCVPCMFLCRLPLIFWKCQRKGQLFKCWVTNVIVLVAISIWTPEFHYQSHAIWST